MTLFARHALAGAYLSAAGLLLFPGCRHRDPNSPEAREEAERERKEDEEKDAQRRAKKEARERERNERNERQSRREERSAEPAPTAASPPVVSPHLGAGTCDASCVHYLHCRGLGGNPDAQQKCVGMCTSMRLTREQLTGFERTDCASAISIVEGQRTGGGAKSSSGSSACNGCVWDGSSCIWLSQSNWGAGAYSGAYSSCDPGCCRR